MHQLQHCPYHECGESVNCVPEEQNSIVKTLSFCIHFGSMYTCIGKHLSKTINVVMQELVKGFFLISRVISLVFIKQEK